MHGPGTDRKDGHHLVPLGEARDHVLARCRSLAPIECDLVDAAGTVLAAPVRAAHDVPPFANSAMDGYALRAADSAGAPVTLVVVGAVMAGEVPAVPVGAGQAVRIMTGAPVPDGADAVCKVERTRPGEPGTVVIERSVDAGENVRAPGEDIAAGDEVFAPGTVLTPAHVGVLASLGVEAVTVHPRPRVAVLATGDELVSGPAPLAPGKIRDANRPALLAQLAEDGFVPVDLGRVGDDPDAVAAALERGGASADAVVVTGGVSVGDRDVAKEVVGRLCDDMRWMQVAIKPAKPFAFGIMTASGVPVFGLPGNPVSALVSYELFARPALRQRAGHGTVDRPRLAAVADADLRRRADGKLHLMRVVASAGPDGTVRVRPVAGQASHQLRSLADADALALVPDGDGVRAGEAVEVLVVDADRLAGPDRTWGW